MMIREAKIEDIPQIQVVRNAVKENTLSDPGLVTDADCAEFLTVRGKGWVCEMDRRIVGFSIVDMKEHNIWALFVHPDFEKQGIGRQLHDVMLNWYFDRTSEPVWLGTAPGTRAETFYRMTGWKDIGMHGKGEVKFEMTHADWPDLRAKLTATMTKTYLTYSRDLGDFHFDLEELTGKGLSGIRLINKGKTAEAFIARIAEILNKARKNELELEILVDLPGEKALIGDVGNGIQVEKGKIYDLNAENQVLTGNNIPTSGFLQQLDRAKISEGDIVSIADGELEMKIINLNGHPVRCEALNSFFLTSNRSFNIKGNKLPVKPVSANDLDLLKQLTHSGYGGQVKILVSFVTAVSHVEYVRQLAPGFHVVSKIETIVPENDLAEIIRASDSVMLGRGDLTSTSNMNDVFPFQKKVIELCKEHDKELILATGLFGELKNTGKPGISDLMDFGFLRHMEVNAFLIAGSNANKYPFETLHLITNFEKL